MGLKKVISNALGKGKRSSKRGRGGSARNGGISLRDILGYDKETGDVMIKISYKATEGERQIGIPEYKTMSLKIHGGSSTPSPERMDEYIKNVKAMVNIANTTAPPGSKIELGNFETGEKFIRMASSGEYSKEAIAYARERLDLKGGPELWARFGEGASMNFIIATKTSPEFGNMVKGKSEGYIDHKRFHKGLTGVGSLSDARQSMNNLFNIVVPQAQLSVEMKQMFDTLVADMTVGEYDRFSRQYRNLIDEMFISSDAKATLNRTYMIDGKEVSFGDGDSLVPREDKEAIFANFMEKLMDFRGVTLEELVKKAGVNIDKYR